MCLKLKSMAALILSGIAVASAISINASSINLQPAAMKFPFQPLITYPAPTAAVDFDSSKLILMNCPRSLDHPTW